MKNYKIKNFNHLLSLFTLSILSVLLSQCSPAETAENALLYDIQKNATADTAMVVSAHPLASEVGKDILQKGGNAIDATIAVQFAKAVVYPRAGNIGGGGFMVIRLADGTAATLDYREKAPLAASRDMYLDSLGNVRDSVSLYGHLSVGVPGTVAGMLAAHKRYGKLPFADLVAPAIKLAKEGFQITKIEAERLNKYAPDFKRYNSEDNALLKTSDWKLGDYLKQANLAATLERIAKDGFDGFYKGKTADYLVAEMQRGNGLITHEDLEKYEAKWREPIIGAYKDFKIISMPPPSSGGVALLQILEMVEDVPLAKYGFHSPEAIHAIVEAERRAYADRAEYLGDSDFYHIPLDTLLNPNYLRGRMADFDPNKASQSDSILAGNFNLMPESFETTHTSIVDGEGNAVSVTTTLNLNYGSKVVVHGAGFLLNDEMDDFSSKPGTPNFFGLVGAEANAIQPEKRMLSSMCPTIVERDGKLFMVLGTPGGSTIITSVFQVFTNVAEYNMTLQEAMEADRFHHQWLPNTVMLEAAGLPAETRQKLETMGHIFQDKERIGLVKAILVQPDGRLVGAADPRHEDDDVAAW